MARADNITSGISLFMMLFSTFMGITNATHPIIMRMLKILLPTTLPIANSALPSMADRMLITNSGAEVPNATIVNPITRSLTPHFFATDDAPSVRQLAPTKIKARPPINNRMFIIIIAYLWLKVVTLLHYMSESILRCISLKNPILVVFIVAKVINNFKRKLFFAITCRNVQ